MYCSVICSDPPTTEPSGVAVDETAVKIDGEWSWLHAVTDPDTKLAPHALSSGRHGADPAATFLHGLRETRGPSGATFLGDQFGYRTSHPRLGLSGRGITLTGIPSNCGFIPSISTSNGSTARGRSVG